MQHEWWNVARGVGAQVCHLCGQRQSLPRIGRNGFSPAAQMANLCSAFSAALSSGTAVLHLAPRLLGLQRGEEVRCPTFTFSASANPIAYEGGTPVFTDSEAANWNMNPCRSASPAGGSMRNWPDFRTLRQNLS